MKRYFVILASAVLALAACSKGLETVSPKAELVPMTFNVVNGDPETELTLSGTSLSWKSGDAISIIDGELASRETPDPHNQKFIAAADGASVSFTGSAAEVSEYYAVSPYMVTQHMANSGNSIFVSLNTVNSGLLSVMLPYKQYGYVGNVDPAAMIMAAKSESKDVAMKQVCGLVKFTIPDSGVVAEIEFKGNGEEQLSGPVFLDLSSGTPVISKSAANSTDGFFTEFGLKYIRMVPSSGTTFQAGTYYMAVPPTDFTNGITMIFKKANGQWAWKSGSAQLNLHRAEIIDLGSIGLSSLSWKNVVELPFIEYPKQNQFFLPFTTAAAKEPMSISKAYNVTTWPTSTNYSGWNSTLKTLWPLETEVDLQLKNAPAWLSGSYSVKLYYSNYIASHSVFGLRMGNATSYVLFPAVSGKKLAQVIVENGELSTVKLKVTDTSDAVIAGGAQFTIPAATEHTFTLTDDTKTVNPCKLAGTQVKARRIIAVYE